MCANRCLVIRVAGQPDDLESTVIRCRDAKEPSGRERRLDELPMRAVPGDTVGFAKIDEFKGLENDAVMVAALLEPRFWEHDLASHYVAMSRPQSVLVLVSRTSSGFL